MKPFEFSDLEGSLKTIKNVEYLFQHSGGKTFTLLQELAVLHDIAKNLDVEGAILELGTSYGVSSAILALGNKDSDSSQLPIFTCDCYTIGSEAWLSDTRLSVARFCQKELGLESDIFHLVCHDTLLLKWWDKDIALVFIDAGHGKEEVRNQIQHLAPYVVEGGWMVFHDYDYQPPPQYGVYGVTEAVDDFLAGCDEDDVEVYRYRSIVAIRFLKRLPK